MHANIHSTRHDWTLSEIETLYTLPIPELVFRAQTEHRAHHAPDEVQGCALLSINTGGCAEDCAYWRESLSALEALSAWANRASLATACFASFPRSIRIQKACRSICSSPWTERRWAGDHPKTRWSWSA